MAHCRCILSTTTTKNARKKAGRCWKEQNFKIKHTKAIKHSSLRLTQDRATIINCSMIEWQNITQKVHQIIRQRKLTNFWGQDLRISFFLLVANISNRHDKQNCILTLPFCAHAFVLIGFQVALMSKIICLYITCWLQISAIVVINKICMKIIIYIL